MRAKTYVVEAATEATHWWYVGRRTLFVRMIRRMGISIQAHVLDIGTSTGTNLRMLKDAGFPYVEGLDISPDAVRWCDEKGLGPVKQGDVCDMPFCNERFDLVLATDIVEHVEDDRRALSEIHRVLKPGGRAIITVPALNMLWGLEDEASLHKRRYRGAEIRRLISATGLMCDERFYFNYLLFVPIFLTRALMRRMSHSVESDIQVNSRWINRLLTLVFQIDVASAPTIRPPFGVSYLVVARKE